MSEIIEKIHQLNERAWLARNTDIPEANRMAQEAEAMLADEPEASVLERAASLRTQAYCLDQLGQFPVALEKGLKGMELARASGDLLMIMMMDNVLGNIYWTLGNYVNSLNHYMDGLEIIQKKPDQELEIYLIQGVGVVYFSMGIYEEALKYFTLSTEIAFPEECIGRAIGLNNTAYTLCEMKRSQEALPYALKARELFVKGAYRVGFIEVLHTLGSIYLETGDIDQAIGLFEQSLQVANQDQNPIHKIQCLLGISRVHLMRNELEPARQKLLLILEIAQGISGPAREVGDAHELLARVYQQMGNYQLALEQYEAFHSVYVRMYNEPTYHQIHNAQVLREVELTRKEAELYRALAATDALTGILSRREFFDLGAKAILRAQSSQTPVSVLMIDVDNFKEVNDQHGHPVGDQVLAAIAGRLKNSLRQDDLAGRYGGDEFVIFLPDFTPAQSQHIAERCRRAVKDEPFQIGALSLTVTISVGLAVSTPPNLASLEDLILQADQDLLSEKRIGRGSEG